MKCLGIWAGAIVCALLSACSSAGDERTPYTVEGVIQKGPFQRGSQVTIQELTDKLLPSGKVYITTTRDDFGGFKLASPITAPFLEVIVEGISFNEAAHHTRPRMSLHAIVKATPSAIQRVNVNLLTHFQSLRVAALVAGGSTYEDAELQSRNEVLSAFGIPSWPDAFHTMNIAEGGDGNGILLAVSMTLVRAARMSGFQDDQLPNAEYAARARLDLEDGKIDDAGLFASFKEAQRGLGADAIQRDSMGDGLRDYYVRRGQNVTIPAWAPFIDANGNGTADRFDP